MEVDLDYDGELTPEQLMDVDAEQVRARGRLAAYPDGRDEIPN